jgi:alanine racemase
MGEGSAAGVLKISGTVWGGDFAEVGEDVLIFGRHRSVENPLELVAEAMHTILYEVISGLGVRVQRIFVQH